MPLMLRIRCLQREEVRSEINSLQELASDHRINIQNAHMLELKTNRQQHRIYMNYIYYFHVMLVQFFGSFAN